MKLINIILCLILAYNSYSQKVTYGDLINTKWKIDTSSLKNKANKSLQFIDSTNILWNNAGIEAQFNYTLDTASNFSMVHIQNTPNANFKFDLYFLLKRMNNSTLKMQKNMDNSKPLNWDNNEPEGTTGLLIKM